MATNPVLHFLRRHKARLLKAGADIRDGLWFRPSLWLAVYTLAALGLLTVDWVFAEAIAGALPSLAVSADGARTMLGGIATATLTVTSLAFSLMMVAVVQTANAYSPRILRRFIGDRRNQNALGVLLGTFAFALLGLRAASGEGAPAPLLTTNIAVVLTLTATLFLLSFIHHVADSVKVSSIIRLIVSETGDVLPSSFPADIGAPYNEAVALPQAEPTLVYANEDGYIQLFDSTNLMELAVGRGLILRLYHRMGDHVLAGTPIADIWGLESLDEEVEDAVRNAYALGSGRTLEDDPRFGLQQLTDIALRGLSPGINDPSTAMEAIDGVVRVLARQLQHDPPTVARADEQGHLRLVFPPYDFRHQLNQTLTHLLPFATGDLDVTVKLIRSCRQLALVAHREADRRTLASLLESIEARASVNFDAELEREWLGEALEKAREVLG